MKAGKLQSFPALFLFPTKPQSKNDNILESDAIQIIWPCRCAIWPPFLWSLLGYKASRPVLHSWCDSKNPFPKAWICRGFLQTSAPQLPHPFRSHVMKISSLNGRKVPFLSMTSKNSHALIHACSSQARPELPELGSHQLENWDHSTGPCCSVVESRSLPCGLLWIL